MKEVKAYELSDGTLVIDKATAFVKQLELNKRESLLKFCKRFLYDHFDTTTENFYGPEELADLLLKHGDELFAALDQDCDSIIIKKLNQ